jgi:hypothetical protein
VLSVVILLIAVVSYARRSTRNTLDSSTNDLGRK